MYTIHTCTQTCMSARVRLYTLCTHMCLYTCVYIHTLTPHLGVFFWGFLIQEFFNLPCCKTDPLSSEF